MSSRAWTPERVLVTADAVGGVFTYAVELARGLCARGVEVTLAVLGPPPSPAQRAEIAAVPAITLAHAGGRLEWQDAPWHDVERAGRILLELAGDARADLAHVSSFAHAALPFHVPVVLGAHSCVASWWRAVHGEPAPAAYDRYRREVARGLAAADVVVAPTRAALEAIVAEHGTAPAIARVVPNGADARRFRPGAKEPLALAAGRLWDPAKNVAALARVAPRVPVRVALAGPTTAPDGQAIALPEGVEALGALDRRELARWLGRASIYALPARYEPFGLSILEAALAGAALVLGDLASLREVWRDAATFVPPDDDDALARAIADLADADGLRAARASAARARALGFHVDRCVEGTLAAYRAAREARARRPSPPARAEP